ncbi:hypothetical protein KSS87_021833 [Heliosperma pusillum]|nr:hypothetical protein KSS87_021833 [Heliosperma pusillum]
MSAATPIRDRVIFKVGVTIFYGGIGLRVYHKGRDQAAVDCQLKSQAECQFKYSMAVTLIIGPLSSISSAWDSEVISVSMGIFILDEVCAELCSLRTEFEDSESKIRKINKSFYSYIKDMKELTSTETATYVKSSLKKMVACQSLLSKMQSCKVERLDAKHGQPNIMFDHGGFLLQSFITKSTSTSGLLITNKLNKEKIYKMFINDMDVYAAFSFALSGDMQLTYQGLRTIAEQTQKTVSRLHILLDVMEEVQLAMMELKNLSWSRFCQPSAGKLDLQLCFTDFRSGARVTLTLDITCLNRGVYPSQILPYEVQGMTARNQDIFESLVEDIRTSVQGVRSGFMRIISICRCVSRMIETGGMTKAADTH